MMREQNRDSLLDAMFDSMAEGILVTEPSGEIVRMNRAMLDLMGFPTVDAAVKHLKTQGLEWQPLDEDGNEIDPSHLPIARGIAGEAFRDVQMEIVRKGQDRRFWLSCSGMPIRDASGSLLGSVVSVRDITAAKDTEKKLQESNALLRSQNYKLDALLENISEGIIMADPSGQITYMNRSIRDWFDLEDRAPTLDGPPSDPWQLFTANREPLAHEDGPLQHALAGETFFGLQFIMQRISNGVERVISASGTLVRDEEGQPLFAVVTYRDISAEKAAEMAMIDLNAELERRVDERTSALTKANRELEGFTYTVSHDLRTPLRAITSSSMILLEDHANSLDEVVKDQLRRQAAAAKKMAALIDDLLFLSRLSRSSLSKVEFNLSKLAEEVLGDLTCQEWGHPVEVDIQPSMYLEADPRLFRFVIQNLIENGCKFAHRDMGAKVVFGQKEIDGKNTYFVSDKGIGFDMAYVAKIFLPFERLVTDSEFPGTGIGLANARRIVELHGGDIWAESKEGLGSTFYFRL